MSLHITGGEPELGYFTSGDPYVIRKDISMLTDAGVDVLILDFTNGTLYPEAWDALFETMTAMKKEGNVVPKICFWGYNNGANTVPKCVDKIYDYYYAQGKYKDLWFYWDGKPLLLYNENETYSPYVKEFFTLRHMWWGYYVQNGKRYVGSEDHWSFGYDMHDKQVSSLTPAERASTHKGRYEQMCVTPAQHASTFVGKSWTVAAGEPQLNQYDLPNKKFSNKNGLIILNITAFTSAIVGTRHLALTQISYISTTGTNGLPVSLQRRRELPLWVVRIAISTS